MARKNTWSAEQIALLGTDTDKTVAGRLGKKPATVTRARIDFGIPAFDPSKGNQHKWTDKEIKMLGNVSDMDIAEKLGISRNAVINARNMRGIAPPTKNTAMGKNPRVPITIRLPAEIVERLRAGGNITAQIECAVNKYFGEIS